uniref:Thioredoxin domain-containing protein n=1 Tax=viral metagenome TaxID=1070528 RepID=A0A6C0KE22_9ZZZZ
MFANLDDAHITVVMYSKFSKVCTSFLEILEKVPTFKHTLLCVDNDETRKRVISNLKLNVTEVPCIFRVYERTGYVESFEGERAFTILNTHYNHYIEKMEKEQLLRSQIPQTTHIPQTQIPQTQQTPLPQMQQTQPLRVSDDMFEIASQPPPNTSTTSTPIEFEPINTYMHIPPSQSNAVPDRTTDRASDRSSDRAVKSGGNIVSRAMQMQKERESDAPSTKGPHSV